MDINIKPKQDTTKSIYIEIKYWQLEKSSAWSSKRKTKENKNES